MGHKSQTNLFRLRKGGIVWYEILTFSFGETRVHWAGMLCTRALYVYVISSAGGSVLSIKVVRAAEDNKLSSLALAWACICVRVRVPRAPLCPVLYLPKSERASKWKRALWRRRLRHRLIFFASAMLFISKRYSADDVTVLPCVRDFKFIFFSLEGWRLFCVYFE